MLSAANDTPSFFFGGEYSHTRSQHLSLQIHLSTDMLSDKRNNARSIGILYSPNWTRMYVITHTNLSSKAVNSINQSSMRSTHSTHLSSSLATGPILPRIHLHTVYLLHEVNTHVDIGDDLGKGLEKGESQLVNISLGGQYGHACGSS